MPSSTPARSELLARLLRDGILYRSPSQPVVSRDGTPANWMLNSLAVTLTTDGAELAGRCVLDLLHNFEGRQIATYGLTGIPILQSCVLQSGGRYRGLLIRKQPKTSGALKVVEGPLDPAEPIVVVDDSISSGISMTESCRLLEAAGLRVEGGVFLVRFAWDRGFGRMVERGYHVEAVYDIGDDFMTRMPGETVPASNPSKIFPDFRWSERTAPEALHPAELARAVLEEYFDSGKLLRPPRSVAGAHDAAGGVWVSLRDRRDLHLRHARDGFWHFPGEEVWDLPEGVVRAALRTALHLPAAEGGRLLGASSIAVTFFGALEPCDVGQLDNQRYGIVVRSRERGYRMGGALPRMPGIANEWEQFQHARIHNARLISFEPYILYRHAVSKAVEPGAAWQPTGVPLPAIPDWSRNPAVCAPLAVRARDIVLSALRGLPETTAPIPPGLLPAEVDSLYVCVYLDGRVRGCMGSRLHDADTDLRTLALAALRDSRFASAPGNGPVQVAASDVAVSVSVLHNALTLGEFTPDEVALRFRHGDQCLMAWQGRQVGLLLPVVAWWYSLGARAFAAEVVRKAEIAAPPYRWLRFDCSTWLADREGAAPMRGAFKISAPALSAESRARLHAAYLARMVKPDGSLYERYEPFQNRLYEGDNPPRSAHAAWVLAQAHRTLGDAAIGAAAGRLIAWHLDRLRQDADGLWMSGAEPSVSELAFLLLALAKLPPGDARRSCARDLAETLWSRIGPHGRIATHRDPARGGEHYQDYYPAQVLLALAEASAAVGSEVRTLEIDRAFRFYRHRFRYRRGFGQASWMMRAFCAWHGLTAGPPYAGLVFEIGDWILQYQQEKTGAFLNDHQHDSPGFTTAVYLEGIAAAAKTAAALGDQARRRRYAGACRRGLAFLDELTIQERDASVLPNARFALGGLRGSVRSSEIRSDFVQHALSASLEFAEGVVPVPVHSAPIEGDVHA